MDERIPEKQIRSMSEDTFARMRIMYPEGSVIGTIHDLSRWE